MFRHHLVITYSTSVHQPISALLRASLTMESMNVLILTTSTGGGHDSVAVALQEALQAQAPQARVLIFDPLSGTPRQAPLSPGRWYDALVAWAPWAWGLFYRATNNAGAVRLGMAASALLWARRLRAVIQAERPGLVVSVHPLCTQLAAAVLSALPSAPPLHCIVTDLVTIHRCWACAAVDDFYVATAEARDALTAMGIPCEHIHVSGLPLRTSFAQAPRAPLDGVVPRVLILGGGSPSRRLAQVARALVATRLPLQLVVVCGRNAHLRRYLAHAVGTHATVLGWHDDMAALMRWSSIVVTRAGPTTVAEALSQARPVVIYQALSGQEDGNIALVKKTGSGCYVPDIDALVRAVTTYLYARPAGCMTRALWWGGAAQRVAARLLMAHTGASAPRYEQMQYEPALERGLGGLSG